MDEKKLAVGDIVWQLNHGSRGYVVIKHQVLTVGRKYYTVSGSYKLPIERPLYDPPNRRQMQTLYGFSHFYFDRKDVEDAYWERSNRYAMEKALFKCYDVETLKKIAELLKINTVSLSNG